MSTINSAVANSSSSGATRRKNGKHSCDQCKVRKCKCDEAVPCGKCTQCKTQCTYLGEDKRKKRPAAAEKLQQCAAKVLRLRSKIVTLGGMNTPSEPASPTSPVHASLGEQPPVEPQGHDPHVANVCILATSPVCPGCANTPLSCQWLNFDFVATLKLTETNTLLQKRLTEVLLLFDKLIEDPYWIPTGSCECTFCGYTSTSRYDLKVHLQQAHGKTIQDMYKCSICYSRFIDTKKAREHELACTCAPVADYSTQTAYTAVNQPPIQEAVPANSGPRPSDIDMHSASAPLTSTDGSHGQSAELQTSAPWLSPTMASQNHFDWHAAARAAPPLTVPPPAALPPPPPPPAKRRRVAASERRRTSTHQWQANSSTSSLNSAYSSLAISNLSGFSPVYSPNHRATSGRHAVDTDVTSMSDVSVYSWEKPHISSPQPSQHARSLSNAQPHSSSPLPANAWAVQSLHYPHQALEVAVPLTQATNPTTESFTIRYNDDLAARAALEMSGSLSYSSSQDHDVEMTLLARRTYDTASGTSYPGNGNQR